MTVLEHQKKLILREHDVKNITLKKIKYKMMTIWDITLSDLYKDKYRDAQIQECYEKGYPVLLNIHGITRLLIFNKVLC